MLIVQPVAEAPRGSYRRPMMIIGMLYFVTGALSWLNGPLTVFVKLAFKLDDAQALLITVVFYVPYFVFALPYASVLKRIGINEGWPSALASCRSAPCCLASSSACTATPACLPACW